MKDNKNYKWTINDIASQYKIENPKWSINKCKNKAIIIYKELNKMNNKLWHDTRQYFKYNTPFSFYDNKDSEFTDMPWDEKWDEKF